ncbi:hypothetical protein [Leuconostoc fallax]|uniref:Preprotein translocase subunit SecB n=1 Tax=Leuconostoc fallax TaxID=1251 RepID=A0A4R5N884_9LACO|nr:hypothetical protein [Leuconostoc fallax]TDG68057.1 hypothetical protein C5L23_000363 [Leuconostoc fallax]
MKIKYWLYRINNLEYHFNETFPWDRKKGNENCNMNIDNIRVISNEQSSKVSIAFKVTLISHYDNVDEEFRLIKFDYKYIFDMEDFPLNDAEYINNFVFKHGLEAALFSVKDVIKKITDLDYQPRINVNMIAVPFDAENESTENI